MSNDGKLFHFLSENLVPKIAEALGKSGENLEFKLEVPSGNHFISSVYFLELIFGSVKNCADKKSGDVIKLVVKMPAENEAVFLYTNSDLLFRNEIVFYDYFAENYDNCTKCVLLVREPIRRAVIVLENVTQFGYETLKRGEKMSLKHVLASVKEIAKFHAKGYVMKEKNAQKFFEIADKIRETKFNDTAHSVKIKVTNAVSMRLINYLRSVDYDEEFCEKMSHFLKNAHRKILEDCSQPRNELAVFCHGDFTSNNVLFKMENDGDFKVKLIDFAQFCYASPAVDISTILYVSCDHDVRKNFHIIFKAYHEQVLKNLVEAGVQNLEKYSYDHFLKDYKRHALFGLEIAIFFTPLLHLDYKVDYKDVIEDSTNYINDLMISGGDIVSKNLADMLLELRAEGGLHHVFHPES